MRRTAEAAGRDPDAIELTLGGGLVAVGPDDIERAVAAGARRMVLGTRERDLANVCDDLSAFADRFITVRATP